MSDQVNAMIHMLNELRMALNRTLMQILILSLMVHLMMGLMRIPVMNAPVVIASIVF